MSKGRIGLNCRFRIGSLCIFATVACSEAKQSTSSDTGGALVYNTTLTVDDSTSVSSSSSALGVSSKLNLTSLKVPIAEISFFDEKESREYSVYTCNTKAESCYVDLVSADKSDVLKAAQVSETILAERNYTRAKIRHCHAKTSLTEVTYKLTGSVELGGATYYTNAVNGLSLTGPAEEIDLIFGTCREGSSSFTFAEAFPYKGSLGKVEFKLKYDLVGPVAASVGGDSSIWTDSGCSGSATVPHVCIYPNMFNFRLDTTMPGFERYFINKFLLLDLHLDGNKVKSGFLRPYFASTTKRYDVSMDGYGVEVFGTHDDGTLSLIARSKTSGATAFTFGRFKRAAHSGLLMFKGDTPDGYKAEQIK